MASSRFRNDLQLDPPTSFTNSQIQQLQQEMEMVPESPLIDRMPSPDHRTLDMGEGNGSGFTPYLSTPNDIAGSGKVPDHLSIPRSGMTRAKSYRPNNRIEPQPQFLHDPSPSTILALLEAQHNKTTNDIQSSTDVEDDVELRTRLILRHALRWAVERGDGELIAWLVGLDGQWADVLDQEVHSLEDEEGWGLVGIAIQCSCGRQDKEEGVRAIVGRWGLQVGARGGRDRTGWTPLHLAALLSTPPLISFLLSRGASPHALTNRGLTPLDLIMGMPDREDVALFLEHATANGQPSSSPPASALPALTPARQKMLDRRRRRATRHLDQIQADEKRDRIRAEREAWLRESARVVDVDPELLINPPRKKRESRGSDDSGLGWMGYEVDLEAERDCDSESEMGMDDEEIDQLNLDSDMLVFSLSHLNNIFDILISDYTPQCQPLPKRTLPANTLFLYARFALYRCDESWLEELIEGAVVRIEQNIYSNTENLACLAFWAYNTTVLLHFLKSDPGLNAACDELGLLNMIEELINAIHVFVIRVAERRIDTVLDAAVLDYETLEDFNDVRFEGEWTLFRSLAPKKKRDLPKAANIFVNGSPGDVPPSPGSPFRTPIRPHQSMGDLRLAASGRSLSHESNISATSGHSQVSSSAPAPVVTERALSPKSITDILSGVLLILQLYEVNPAIVVQAFSQIFFWISCELFNRILTRKKYLCRTKAMQIRMNVTILDDWVRANGIPSKTATKHLEPVAQLLQWLQCLSGIRQFDTLIGTMQNMRTINPLQMRKAVREYRYEVNEGRMTEECSQYLAQLQRDWEKRRIQLKFEEAERRRSESDNSNFDSKSMSINEESPIDALFDGTTSLADFVPQTAPECLGELLESRYMLPFLLPQEPEYLIATPPSDTAYRNLMPMSPFITDGSASSRPPSRSSFSSSRPMGWALPRKRKLRELPPDFFKWFKDRESERRMNNLRNQGRLPSIDTPHNPAENRARTSSPTPTPTAIRHLSIDTNNNNNDTNFNGLLPPLSEYDPDEQTPLAIAYKPDLGGGGAAFPSPSLSTQSGSARSGLNTSRSLEKLRERSSMISGGSFDDMPSSVVFPDDKGGKGEHIRSDSFELKLRLRGGGGYATPTPLKDIGVGVGIGSPNISENSFGSFTTAPPPPDSANSVGSEGKKKWWKLDSKRKIREGSEDTISPGQGWEDADYEMRSPFGVKTPTATTPVSGKKFWG